MTPEELNNRIERLKREAENASGETMVKLGLDALGMIKTRVRETGKDSEGGTFPPYSTKPMLVGCSTFRAADCKSFFGKRKNKEHDWVTLERTYTTGPKAGKKIRLAYLEGGYKELRSIWNREDFVNFSFKNEMWNNIGLVSNASDHNNGVVMIGAQLESEKNKLIYNTERNKRKGGTQDILDLSDSEIEILKKDYLKSFLVAIKSAGL